MSKPSSGLAKCSLVLGSLVWIAVSCSDSTPEPTDGTGGSTSSSSGGTTASSGGSSGSGGSSVGSGGSGSGGVTQGTGGSASGGSSRGTGGRGSGGATTSATGAGGEPGTGGASSGTGGRGITLGGRTGGGGRGGGGMTMGAGGGPGMGGQTGTGAGGSTAPGTDPVKSDGCGKTTTAKTGNGQSISVNGSNRTYNLKLPDNYDMNKAYKLMVAYHWLNGTANNVTSDNYYGLWSLSQNSVIFVAPQGLNNGWSNSGGADVEFSRQLIAKLEGELCIDKSRIFCEGFSMGGSMSYAMASAAPELIRAVAVHSGGSMSGSTRGHTGPVAYFMTHGTKDSVCTYPGYGVPQLQDFAKVNGCTKPDPSLSATAFEAALPEPTSSASACASFEGCKDGFPVRACLFVGDHTWNPAGWTSGETWKFLSQF